MRAVAVKDADTKRRRGRDTLSQLHLAEDSVVGIQRAGHIGIWEYVEEDGGERYIIDEISYLSVVFHSKHCETMRSGDVFNIIVWSKNTTLRQDGTRFSPSITISNVKGIKILWLMFATRC